jgi:hypothetical protein
MVESVFVIVMICLCLFAVFQYANLFSAKLVLEHAAARAARARTVGFNQFMVEKSARVAAIPASGTRLAPPPAGIAPAISAALKTGNIGRLWSIALSANVRSPGAILEVNRVPDYMDSVNHPSGAHILDYELWDALSVDIDEPMRLGGSSGSTLTVSLRQRHPLLIALDALAEGRLRGAEEHEGVTLGGAYTIESHYPLYMEDMNW